jgi:hypothetical protein
MDATVVAAAAEAVVVAKEDPAPAAPVPVTKGGKGRKRKSKDAEPVAVRKCMRVCVCRVWCAYGLRQHVGLTVCVLVD